MSVKRKAKATWYRHLQAKRGAGMSTREKRPLTADEYQHWKDTALLDGDLIDRFADTIDSLRARNAGLLVALEKISGLAEHHEGVFQTDFDVGEAWLTDGFVLAVDLARAAIAQEEQG